MALHGLTLFCLTYFLATATPGPGIGAILARVLGRGTEGLVAFIAGYVVGDLIWFTLAATGMVMLAQTAHSLFVVIKYAGAACISALSSLSIVDGAGRSRWGRQGSAAAVRAKGLHRKSDSDSG